MASDRHIRRSGDDYGEALAALLPWGIAWSRDRFSVIMRVVRALAQIWGYVDGRAADLLERESDPRMTVELLPDWERNFGLPDPCFAEPMTIADRQIILVKKMTMIGAQSRAFFIGVMGDLGHEIAIREWSPFMCGVSRVGDTRGEWGEIFASGQHPMSGEPSGGDVNARPPISGDSYEFRWEIGRPEMRFYWSIRVSMAKQSWFRCGSGQCAIDPHLRIGVSDDLECLLDRWRPAQTELVFDYSYLRYGGPMQGTP